MNKHELSRVDFEALDEALSVAIENEFIVVIGRSARVEKLRDLFRKAHTGWLEVEDEK